MFRDDINPAVDRSAFARSVKASKADELMRLMRGRQRGAVLDEIFDKMPEVFREDRAATIDAIVHWRIGDRTDGGVDTYEVSISNGVCTTSGSPEREPSLVLGIGAVDFIKMVTGNASPVMLFMRGRMKARGDLGLATKFPSLFDLPRA